MKRADIELMEIFKSLNADVSICATMIQQEHSTIEIALFWRRAYVRSVFAFIEGVTHRMKLLAFEDKDKPDVNFSPAELSFLLDEDFEIDDKGRIVSIPAKISLVKNILFAFKAVAQSNRITYILNVGDAGWEALRKSIKIRDRLMHPKKMEDTIVSNDDINLVIKGASWYIHNFLQCFQLVQSSLQAEVERKQTT